MVANNLIYVYDGLEREIPFCLYGDEIDGRYIINELKMPFIYESEPADSSDGARAKYVPNSCSKVNYLGMIHNHPNNRVRCMPSPVDLRRFINDRHAEIEVIACQADRRKHSINISVIGKK